jgi:hypothetical protein
MERPGSNAVPFYFGDFRQVGKALLRKWFWPALVIAALIVTLTLWFS